DGSQGRRTVWGIALIVLPIALPALSGCEQIPVPRANAAPIHIPPPNPPTAQPTSVQLDERELLPPLPGSLAGATLTPASTPLIDEALAVAGVVETERPPEGEPIGTLPPPEKEDEETSQPVAAASPPETPTQTEPEIKDAEHPAPPTELAAAGPIPMGNPLAI